MKEFVYETEGSRPLDLEDLYRLFNNYRIWKNIWEMLSMLNKTSLAEYRILEPGCGGGSKLRQLAEFRARPDHCFGFDMSKRAIDAARFIAPDSMNFYVASAFEIPFKDNVFDLVLCSGLFSCFKDTNDIRRIAEELRRTTKEDGVLLVVEITEKFPLFKPTVQGFRFFDTTKNELEGILSGQFRIFRRVNAFMAEGYPLSERWARIEDLPYVDKAIDDGNLPCAYCLYAFLTAT